MQKLQESLQMDENIMSKTILVVEDDDSIGSLLVDALSQETAYTTILVTDGLQALRVMCTLKPCLVITDYLLPYMDGIELFDRVHAMAAMANVPTILMSADMPEKEVGKRDLIGLAKPFELDELLDTVEDLLERSA
ncbi:response regulator [Dictyobacter alpinus]|uniref:Response regulator n=2 Tax=Dictyobacter alpinus TaxID=2014873 RepID=A0A402B5V3_9CHLR|nr:response regulator [Dictyobacter alpinus]